LPGREAGHRSETKRLTRSSGRGKLDSSQDIYFAPAKKPRNLGSRNCLKKLSVVFLILLSIISGLYLAPVIIGPSHAATPAIGEVCISRNTDTFCPQTSPTIAGPTSPGPGVQFRFSILVNASGALNGFDITLLTNRTVLKPAGVSTTNSALPGQLTILAKCIGGVGIGCTATDNASTLHLSAQAGGGQLTFPPTTGLLFTAIYNVTALSANTPVTFQSGCTSTSVTGGVCVTISNGSVNNVPETSQGAKFSNAVNGYFDIEADTGNLQVSQGDVTSAPFLTITSLNGFNGIVNLIGSSSPPGPIVTVSPNSVPLTAVAPGNQTIAGITVNVTKTVPIGNYTLSITGTSLTVPPNTITIHLIVPKPDFSVTPTPNTVNFNVTVLGTSNIIIASIGNYAANVTLSETTSSPGLNAYFANNQPQIQLKLRAGSTNATLLTLNSTIAGSYSVNVTATSGVLFHFAPISVHVLDYALSVNDASVLNVVNGTTTVKSINIDASAVYNVTVTIGKSPYVVQVTNAINSPSSGVKVGCSLLILKLTYSGNTNGHNTTNCQVTGQAVGNYIVTVTATSGIPGRASNHALSFLVAVVKPNFIISIPPTLTIVSVGSSANIPVVFAGNHGLNDNITVNLVLSNTGLSPLPSISSNASTTSGPCSPCVRITTNSPNSTLLITITTSPTTAAGFYTLTIDGSGIRSNPTELRVSLQFLVVSTTSPHNLSVYSVAASTTSATVGADITITIVVQNLGRLSENATIIAIVGDQNVGTKNATIAPGANVTETFTWHTSSFNPGAYMVGGKVLGYNVQRSATPITLNAANTSPFNSQYTIPAIAIAAIIVIAAGLIFYFLPRRKIQTT